MAKKKWNLNWLTCEPTEEDLQIVIKMLQEKIKSIKEPTHPWQEGARILREEKKQQTCEHTPTFCPDCGKRLIPDDEVE